MKPHSDITDPRVVKALAHPLRVRILGLLEDRTASPSELAEELEAPLGNVSYHVRQLAALGLIKLVKKTPRRGAIEHHYKAEARPQITDQAWADVPEIVKRAMIGATLGQISEQVNEAAAEQGFARAEAHVTRTQFAVDAQGWRELAEELARVLGRLEDVERRAAERLADGGGHGAEERATLVMLLFDSPDTEVAELAAAGTARGAAAVADRDGDGA